MNTRLNKMLHEGVIPLMGGVFIDCYNQSVNTDIAGTIIAGVDAKNHYFVTEMTDAEQIVLGWTRDEKGNVTDRHPVEVANAVTSSKRDNTQNYVMEQNNLLFEPVNDQDGVSRTIKAQYQQSSVANFVRSDAFGATGVRYGIRIRKLTERECFRLMDVPEEYIDRIQASGVSRSQQYKMAGNSIVVACMYHIFDKLFINTTITEPTLF